MTDINPDAIFESKYKGESYIEDYETFMKTLENQGGNMAAGEVGEMVARMANHFIRYNLTLSRASKLFHAKAQQIYSQNDGGKPISAAKADIVASATPEASAYQEAKVHVQNIEQCINALKSLQRGIQNEYSHSAT